MISLIFKTPKAIATDLGHRAKQARLLKDWSRKTLATRSGVPESTIKRFELTGAIGVPALIDLAIALGRVDDLAAVFTPAEVPSIADMDREHRQRGRS